MGYSFTLVAKGFKRERSAYRISTNRGPYVRRFAPMDSHWLSVLVVRGTIHPPRSSFHHLRPGRIPSLFLRFPWEQGSCYKRLTQELLRTPLPSSHVSFGHTKPILVLGRSRLPFPLPETHSPALARSAASHVLGLYSKVTSSGALPAYPDIPPGHHSLPHGPIIFSIALATL